MFSNDWELFKTLVCKLEHIKYGSWTLDISMWIVFLYSINAFAPKLAKRAICSVAQDCQCSRFGNFFEVERPQLMFANFGISKM